MTESVKFEILYIDDEQTKLDMFKNLFGKHYTIHTVLTNEAGYGVLEKRPIKLIVADQQMPEASGLDFLKRVKSRWPYIQSILLADGIDQSSIHDAINVVGIFQFVTMPYAPDELKTAMDQALAVERMRYENEQVTRLLSESEAKFRSIFESTVDLFTRANNEGILVMVSPSIYNILGYKAEEVVHKKVLDFYVNKEDRSKIIESLEKTGRCNNFETQIYSKKGEVVHVLVNSHYYKDEQGNILGIESLTRDISQRKKAQLELEKSRHHLAIINENSPDIIVTINKAMKITYVNRVLEGFTYEDILGNSVLDFVPAEFHTDYINRVESAFKGEQQEFEMRALGINSQPAWYGVRMAVIGDPGGNDLLLITSSDITTKQVAVKKMRQQVSWNRQLLSTTLDGYILADKNGFILEVNESSCHMTGYTSEELIGMNIKSLEHTEDEASAADRDRKIIMQRKDRFEARYKHKDGHIIDVDISIAIIGGKKKDAMFAAFVRDISERKRTEQNLWRSEQKATMLSSILSLSSSPTTGIEEVCTHTIELISKFSGWPIAHIYYYSGELDLLIPSNIWHVEDSIDKRAIAGFKSITKNTNFAFGEGLPGRVWKSGETEWIPDVNMDTNYPRNTKGQALNVKGAFAFPIISNETVVAVLEFYDVGIRVPDIELIALSEEISKQLSIVFDRVMRTAAIRASEEHLKRVFEGANVGMAYADSNGNVTDSNKEFANIVGYSEEEIPGMNLSVFTHPEDLKVELPLLAELFEGKRDGYRIDKRYITKTGDTKWIDLSVSAIRNEDGQIIAPVGIVVDITKQKQTSEMLKALGEAQTSFISHENSKNTFEKLLDLALTSSKSEYGFIGEILEDEDQNPYLKSYAITDISWNDETAALYEKHLASGLEFRNLNTLFGNVITTEKPVISNDPANDPRSGGLPKGHPAMHNFLGLPFYNDQKMIGMIGVANRPGGYDKEICKAMQPILATCSTLMIAKQNMEKREKAERETLILNESLEERVEQRTMELERAQKELAQSLEKEKELSQLKSHFVATASHQFRTPLTVIQSSLGVLELQMNLMDGKLKAQFEKAYGRIQGQINKMTDLMNDVLLLGKINAGSVKPKFSNVDIVFLCKDLASKYGEIQTENQYIHVKVLGKEREIKLDPKLVEHALSNIMSNALKYSKNGIGPVLTIDFQKEKTAISVKDDGIGIPENELDKIFEPFYRATNAEEINGTGLGMSIVKEYIELNKGTVCIQSKLMEGTTIHIEFPQ